MVDGGYFPKRIEARPDFVKAPTVREICSVSDCISSGPKNWIDLWLHNEFGWFNTILDARRITPVGQESVYRLFAYRIHREIFRDGVRVPLRIPADVNPQPIPASFRRLGFDCVNRSTYTVLGFECSPLSCNSMADEILTNEFCLFPTFEAGLSGAERFSREQPEPGDYFLIEVLERTDEITAQQVADRMGEQ